MGVHWSTLRGKAQQVEGNVAEVMPCDFFLWPQHGPSRYTTSIQTSSAIALKWGGIIRHTHVSQCHRFINNAVTTRWTESAAGKEEIKNVSKIKFESVNGSDDFGDKGTVVRMDWNALTIFGYTGLRWIRLAHNMINARNCEHDSKILFP
jgi:metal-dependent amidase/aminoacylase/carboxypeptidase family protein